ncbi:unnamed protein product [Nippostrongylus brasiliensis]|uniref:Uncharacterized protein n=1 Tax=Nippostrongylus brasiliensis TaxID=27835 RepID=A0A0N4YR37_NIPBR|nr:unnamed protein product [Nippostrongylus brasiliensis]
MPFADRAGRLPFGGFDLPGVPQTAEEKKAKRSFEKELAHLRREYYGRENLRTARIDDNEKVLEARESYFRVMDDGYETVLKIVYDRKEQLKWDQKLEKRVAYLRPPGSSSSSEE